MKTVRSLLFIVQMACITALCFTQTATAAPRTAAITEQARASDAAKAVPGELTYQGFLASSADSSAVTATLEMTFRLFDSETKGAELWAETHPAVEVGGGLFQVQLGGVTPFPPGLFDGPPRWLQTEVGAEVFAPRKPLVSVAYSHRANSAEMLLDLTLLDLDNRWVNEDDLNHLDAQDGDPANAVYVDVAGRVGVGTTSPARNVHIYDESDGVVGIEIENPNTGSSSKEMITFTDENGGVAGLATYDDGSTYPSAMRIYNNRPNGTIGLVAGSLERVRISNDGKVGIGTTSPAKELDVNGDVIAAAYWGDGSHLTGVSGTTDNDWTVSNDTIYHQTGVVGIGTACPEYPLHVYQYAAYSPAYAGYFHAIGHEATGNAYAVYAQAQADDENAYGIYSTATSTWGQAYAGYFDGDVEVLGDIHADTLTLGSASKAGTTGQLSLYMAGSANPILVADHHYFAGGKINLYDDAGNWHTRLEADVSGTGGFFEVWRSDSDPGFWIDGNAGGTNEPTVAITGTSRDAYFQMGQPGDTSVVLPDGAVSAAEIKDEPGVSNELGKSFFFLSSGNTNYTVDTLEIDIPAPGYVEVTAGCYLNLFHTQGTDTEIWVAIDQTAGNADWGNPGAKVASVPDSIPTTLWQFPCTSTRMYEETAAGLKRYYLNAQYYTGTDTMTNVARSYISAAYYPTLYGSLTLAETDGGGIRFAAPQGSSDGTQPVGEPPRRTVTREDHNARLEAEMTALRAELEALKEEVRNR